MPAAAAALLGVAATAPGVVAAGTIRRLDSLLTEGRGVEALPGRLGCEVSASSLSVIVSGPPLLGVAATAPGVVAAGASLRLDAPEMD